MSHNATQSIRVETDQCGSNLTYPLVSASALLSLRDWLLALPRGPQGGDLCQDFKKGELDPEERRDSDADGVERTVERATGESATTNADDTKPCHPSTDSVTQGNGGDA